MEMIKKCLSFLFRIAFYKMHDLAVEKKDLIKTKVGKKVKNELGGHWSACKYGGSK